jgi:hypothetical protein
MPPGRQRCLRPPESTGRLYPDRVALLVLLSRYYCQWTPRLRRPGAIAPYSTLIVKGIAGAVARRLEGPESRLNFGQVGPFIRDQQARAEVVLRFRTERPPFWALNDHLVTALISRRKMIPGCGHRPDPSGSSSGKQTRTDRFERPRRRYLMRTDLEQARAHRVFDSTWSAVEVESRR